MKTNLQKAKDDIKLRDFSRWPKDDILTYINEKLELAATPDIINKNDCIADVSRRLSELSEQAEGYVNDQEDAGDKKTAHYYRGASMAYSVSNQLLKNALNGG